MSDFAMLLLKRASMSGILKMNSSENSPLEEFSNFFRIITFTTFSILQFDPIFFVYIGLLGDTLTEERETLHLGLP